MPLPIDLDLLKKREEIPAKLAELSYLDPEQAVVLLRKWGEDKSPITTMHKEILTCLKGSETKCQKNCPMKNCSNCLKVQ